jgi:hypothetical protein
VPDADSVETRTDDEYARLRPEVLACERRAGELRAEADDVERAAEFWAALVDHGHDGDNCDREDCYQAWREYPDG